MNPLEFNTKIAEITEFPRPSHFIYEVEFYIGNELKFKPYSTVNCDFTENYRDEIGATVILTVAMSRGDYMRHVYPNRDKQISIKLRKKFTNTNSNVLIDELKGLVTTYRAFCHDLKDQNLQAAPNVDNDLAIANYKFELIETNLYDFRTRKCGGVFPHVDKIDLIKFLYHKAAMDIPENLRSLGVTADKANVDQKRKQLVIPNGTPLINLPKYIQDEEGGIYNHDIANFFSTYKKRWYIFPTFNTARHEECLHAMEIYLTPPNLTGMLDRTWMYEEDAKRKLSIVSTGNFQAEDNQVFNFLNQGNGVQFLKADELLDEFSTVDANKVTVGTKHRAGFLLKERDDSNQVVNYTARKVTNNVAKAMSGLSRRGGMYISVVWTHSRPDLVVPGMPVTIFYNTESEVLTKIGLVHEAINTETRVQANMINETMFSTTVLIIWVDDPDSEIKSL